MLRQPSGGFLTDEKDNSMPGAGAEAQPMMEVLPTRETRPATTDTYGGPDNRIDYREQTFDIPTIEPERFDDFRRDNRLPTRESAFLAPESALAQIE
jgi:hypothetical protein